MILALTVSSIVIVTALLTAVAGYLLNKLNQS